MEDSVFKDFAEKKVAETLLGQNQVMLNSFTQCKLDIKEMLEDKAITFNSLKRIIKSWVDADEKGHTYSNLNPIEESLAKNMKRKQDFAFLFAIQQEKLLKEATDAVTKLRNAMQENQDKLSAESVVLPDEPKGDV